MYRERLADLALPIEYTQRETEVEAAYKAMEPHWPAFDQLYPDREAFTERARLLFTEERFAPHRFTAADVQRAFDKLGKPSDWKAPGEFERVLSPMFELRKNASEAELGKAREATMRDVLWPLLTGWSLASFTPDRRRQLHDQLQALRGNFLDEGDVGGVQLAQGVQQLLEHSEDQGRRYLLNSVCLKSCRRYVNRLEETSRN